MNLIILSLPSILSALTGVSIFQFPPDGSFLRAVYVNSACESCKPKRETVELLRSIAIAVEQQRELPEYNAFALTLEVQGK